MTDEGDARYEVVLAAATGAMQQQEAALESIRARAGTLIAAAAISTSFLGAEAFDTADLRKAAMVSIIAALATFLAVLAGVLFLLWPRPWLFHVDASALIETSVEHDEPLSLNDLRRDLALHLQDAHQANEESMRRLWFMTQVVSVALVAEVLAWVAALWLR